MSGTTPEPAAAFRTGRVPLPSAVMRAPRALLAATAAVLLAGCGTSVADADVAAPTTSPTPVPSPFCTAARSHADALRPLALLAQRGGAKPGELASAVAAVHRADSDLVANAPRDQLGLVQRYVDLLNTQIDALVRAGGDAGDPAVVAASASHDAQDTAQQVAAYVMRHCPHVRN
jgi:hypothetical protein